jgi:hypothetical protein
MNFIKNVLPFFDSNKDSLLVQHDALPEGTMPTIGAPALYSVALCCACFRSDVRLLALWFRSAHAVAP